MGILKRWALFLVLLVLFSAIGFDLPFRIGLQGAAGEAMALLGALVGVLFAAWVAFRGVKKTGGN